MAPRCLKGLQLFFLAQLFGIDLSTTGIVMIFIMAMVSSVGAPGMPSGSMSGMQLVLLAAGIPLEAIAILLIIERPLDTFRTAVNVQGGPNWRHGYRQVAKAFWLVKERELG